MDGAAFVGDTVFAPNLGTARVDFPGGSAQKLYASIQKIYALADDTMMYLCHDYPKDGLAPRAKVTIGEQKRDNILCNGQTSEADFVTKRNARDATLAVPKLLVPSIQTNMRGGDFGKKHANGIHYIKVPINVI
jgi:glyoxylase-like metal-dependent hydrolase (beta-lactamase superfamily II)